ncbi:conserved hypothetical protein [Culex quinquefasciatus]|uniref:C2H2-type domain-containing protein n=1 Tax=Culex quinquefasciatus TaxID=7176 RepID=B0WB39_CULQU|nr:conserved hypothetical protein [Culex quinquefasciatus]|eukprot:XP_001845923.1 conserved hypothetical protein [Culex quinquefasciatus]
MAASVYATPPPDFSGEEAAMSDTSNSSQTNSSINSAMKASKRSLSSAFLHSPQALNTATQLSSDSLPDLSKKRRKQSMPSRISGNGVEGEEVAGPAETTEADPQETEDTEEPVSDDIASIAEALAEQQNNFQKIFLSNLRLTLKKELMQDAEWDGEIRSSSIPNITKPDDWLSIPGLPFPFPPEAAAALSASGYLPQLPLLGLPSASSFNAGDNGNRPNLPPLKIFNPEAYCELCNKEFCNKYFLKTHKANKHGIYEPQSGANESLPNLGSFNPFSQLSQVFQMQQQQAALQEQQDRSNQNNHNQAPNNDSIGQQQPLARPTASPKLPMNPIQPTVFCDICCKKFSSLSAMRKHRSKAHEVSHNQQQQQQQQQQPQFQLQQHLQQAPQSVDQRPENLSPSDVGRTTPSVPQFRIPEGFREDYSIEQEDASFTPQPRKLSPASIQAAREANFSADKLKRLGVMNPEAFCEICCKEYCNKYFLRTHKLKRHGIFLPPDEIKEERNPWSFVQTSPLNLIVGGADVPGFPPPLKKLSDASNHDLSRAVALKEELFKSVNTNGDGERNEEENDDKQGMSSAEQEAEAISVDLQKLQSMIMQLNDLNNQRKMTCGICGKEMENQYLLHAHMIQEHNNMNENNNGMKSPLGSTPMPSSPSEYEVCKQCDKEFSNAFVLKQHLIEAHGAQNVSPKREGFITPERPTTAPNMNMPAGPGYGDRKPTFSMTPTSSYCEICNKELCNKYFMKTHMQRMHGIEIENGAQIGGVVCNICNKELCSKYFLRVHKHNTHGIVEEGAPLPQPRNNGDSGDNSELAFSAEGLLKPGEISDLSNRYYSHFTEVCPLCSRRFRSAKWLRAHLLSDHGKMGVDKLRELELKLGSGSKSNSPSLKIPNGSLGLSAPEQKFNPKVPFGFNSPDGKFLLKNPFSGLFGVDPTNSNVGPNGYQCSYCPFATPLLPLLFIHERTHTNLNMMQQQLMQEEEQKQHVELSPIQLPIIKSESAAAPAKEANRFPVPNSIPTSETPSLTPASTPVPAAPQESTARQASPQLQNAPTQPTFERESPNQPEFPKSPALKSDHNVLLSEMANLTQRPAVYALPQQSGPLLMQSFLLEESARASPKNGEDHSSLANRFVPAVVFLPVKERILSPMTISFTLSPA